MTALNWKIQSFLPKQEPNLNNLNAYLMNPLISGSSEDAQFVFDALYSIEKECFILTLMNVDNELGFIEHETRLYPQTRAELVNLIEQFKTEPMKLFTE